MVVKILIGFIFFVDMFSTTLSAPILVCGQTDNCLCVDNLVHCQGLPELSSKESSGKSLIIEKWTATDEDDVSNLMEFAYVLIRGNGRICEDHRLITFDRPDCFETTDSIPTAASSLTSGLSSGLSNMG